MKLWLRVSILVFYYLALGTIFVPTDFSSPVSASRSIFNWLVRLLVAIGFTALYLLISKGLRGDTAESYPLIDRGSFSPDPDPAPSFEGEHSLEPSGPRKSWSNLWSPRNLIYAAVCVGLLSQVIHSAILCNIIFIAVAVFLWMPNPWQSSADQPEAYEISPRSAPR